MDQVRPLPTRSLREHANVDWSTYPLPTPSGGGPAPTPYRSETPAIGHRKKGLTNRGPLQKGGQSEACPPCNPANEFCCLWWARRKRLCPPYGLDPVSSRFRMMAVSRPGSATEASSEIIPASELTPPDRVLRQPSRRHSTGRSRGRRSRVHGPKCLPAKVSPT